MRVGGGETQIKESIGGSSQLKESFGEREAPNQ